MIGKLLIFTLAFFVTYSAAQTCLAISGPCVGGSCLNGDTCINSACCTTDASQNCNNTLPDDFCNGNVDKCQDPSLQDAMSKQCARACKTCAQVNGGSNSSTTATTAPGGVTSAPSTCVDKTKPDGTSDCVKDAYLCNNPAYYDLMTQQCPKTCNRCSGSSSSGTGSGTGSGTSGSACVDKTKSDGTSDCQRDAYLCNNAAYYDLMTQQCPKTCGRC